ncbi:Mitochondrial ribonuclease P protein 1 [Portunus trituberculatus]|uniref:Mitochondrial ribonuclease P protein 1 n=1 Tax=Portunus trituberculatus TaxID=210409 RepID=A0A5B7HYZ0_PORTR|nr:Mitochondrial ribonuclease P protein 1 [Portunus trituberculatus]
MYFFLFALYFLSQLQQPEYPLIINPKSYLKKYPKEQLVYLTPHCQEELLVYDHNAVYIIGGIVDKSSGEPLTLAKAKREGVRMQKLPLDSPIDGSQLSQVLYPVSSYIIVLAGNIRAPTVQALYWMRIDMADFPRRPRQEKRILSLAEAIVMVLESGEYVDSNSDDSSGEEYVPTAEDLEEMKPVILPSSRRGSGVSARSYP